MLSKTKKLRSYKYDSMVIYILYSIILIAPAGAVHLDALNNSCIDCHRTLSPFTDEQNRFTEIRQDHIERNVSCSLECHGDIMRKRASDNFQQWSDSEHAGYYVTCNVCHGGDPNAKTKEGAHAAMKVISDPASTIYFKNIPETCGKCHADEIDTFKNTMHYQRLRAESRAPSCIACHKPHSFKVLKASELTPLCSICHNSRDLIARADVPNDAKQALEKADELKKEVLKARNAVAQAKAAGKDISSAQVDLDKAESVADDIPSLWHEFNLKDFDQQIENGIDWAKRAEYKTSGAEPTVPTTPGTGIALVFGILVIAYLMRKV